MKRTSHSQNVFLGAVTAAGVWTAGVVLDLPWLVQPWQQLWAGFASLWS